MRIGILTYHRAVNYGAVMQAYSLSRRIARDFPDATVEIIDYNPASREFFKLKCPLVFTYRRGFGDAIKKARQTSVFNRFVTKNLPVGKRLLGASDKKLKKYVNENYDVVIVGSDAVFNWNDIGLPNPYFLPDIKVKAKLSYAASSHLQRYGDVTLEKREFLGRALADFDYVGVRDDSTARFVSDFTAGSVVPHHNCDPTIFLDMDFPECELKEKLARHGFVFGKKTVFVMLMHPEYGAFVRRYFGDGVQIVALMDGNHNANIYLHDLNPFEWAHVFKYGDLLVTDYFHGTILSLKNHIPVLSIDASRYCADGYESKAHDLLIKRLDQPFMYVNSSEVSGEEGYSKFADKISEITEKFDTGALAAALSREADEYLGFAEKLKEAMAEK